MGGTTSGDLVYYAPLANGLGNWTTSPNRLPGTATGATSFVNNNTIYVIAEGNPQSRNKVYYARINSPVGAWSVSPYELPNGIYASTSILNDNYVYVMGGANNNVLDTVYYANVSDLIPPIPVSNVCFPGGTPVETDQGTFSIEKINPKIHTIRNSPINITKTVSKETYLVMFKKDALGINYPSATTIMSQQHAVMYKGRMRTAKYLLDKGKGSKVPYAGEPLYNVLMKEHSYIRINNLVCETLDPSTLIAKLYGVKKGKRQSLVLK
jgi:hypothetical protein